MPPKSSRRRRQQYNRAKRQADAAPAGAEGKNGRRSKESDAEAALRLKTDGNTAFAAGRFEAAVDAFSAAIALDDGNHVFFSNRSAALLQLGEAARAEKDAEDCIRIAPSWAKGYSRLGAARFHQGDYTGSLHAYEEGLVHEPTNQTLSEGAAQARAEVAKASSRPSGGEPAGEPSAGAGGAAGGADTSPVIGIDLGTTFSCVGIWEGDRVEVLASETGSRTTPSVVAFTGDRTLVGEAAVTQAASNPRNTVFDAKRLIGGKFSDRQVQDDMKHFPFTVLAGADDKPLIEIDGPHGRKRLAPEQVSALVLAQLKRDAERYLGQSVSRAVITVPAYFTDAQRQATKNAGAVAGLEVLRIVNEPTAAAIAYGLDKQEGARNVLIFDLGGGTFDVSLLAIEDGIFEVQATAGDTHLGGEDFDNNVVAHVSKEIQRRYGLAVEESQRAMKRLRFACERAKRTLSTATTASIDIEGLMNDVDVRVDLSRAKFEQLNDSLFQRCLDTVRQVLRDAKKTTADVADIVLVGGSTRIPKIQEVLREFFGGRELCKGINPDEAVACGAAVQAAILSGQRNSATQSLLLVDVTPLTLGIELAGGVMSPIIKRNSQIPCRKTKQYSTEEDYQEEIEVKVFEGERARTDGNNLLGTFMISGIERAKRGEPKVDVTFDLDANGILNVSAVDATTGSRAHTTIANSRGAHSGDDIARMVEEAEQMRAADEAFVARIEAKQDLERRLYEAREMAGKTGNESLSRVVASTQSWLDLESEAVGAPLTAFAEKQEALEMAMQRVA